MSIIAFLSLTLVAFTKCDAPQHTALLNTVSDTGYTYHKATPDGIGKFYFSREIAHVMGAAGAGWLERNERQEEENSQLAIDSMNLLPSASVADIGAGTGYYTFKIAPKVPLGKVYAVEIQDGMIRYLQENKRKHKLNNVEIITGSNTSPNLPANSIDLAFMVDVYHELEYPAEVLRAVYKALKSDGRLLLLEYRGEDPAIPIKALHKTTVMQLNKELGANGFHLVYRGEFLPIQHFLIYGKSTHR